MAFVSAIIVAAGDSTRMGTAESKQFLPLLGKPALAYTLRAFQDCAPIEEIVVVCRAQDAERVRRIASDEAIDKLTSVTEGGACRAESVQNGILAADSRAAYYAIHDGARPLVTPAEIASVVEMAYETGAATLGTAVTDTIKFADENDVITGTPDRGSLRAVQTPQVFERELYAFAVSDAEDLESVTDDCSLIEKMGGEVQIVTGNPENIKLTTPIDVLIAESILRKRNQDDTDRSWL